MTVPTRRAYWVTLLMTLLSLAGCDPISQEVTIVAEEYRFSPGLIQLDATRPFNLTIVNRGREPHDFTSRLLTDPTVNKMWHRHPGESHGRDTLRIMPGRSLTVGFNAPAGTYLYRCRIRGHSGMRGTLIIE